LRFAQEILVGKKGEVLDYKGSYFEIDCKRRVVVDDTGTGPGETTAPKRGADVRKGAERGGRGIPIVSYDTVVQPRVSQVYTFITALHVLRARCRSPASLSKRAPSTLWRFRGTERV
jgi:hypothetical protein